MPCYLAFLGQNKADSIISAHPEIKHWYIGGHSLGGYCAAEYAFANHDKLEGVVLLDKDVLLRARSLLEVPA